MVWARRAAALSVAILVLDAGGVVRAGQGRCELAEAMGEGKLMLSCSVTAPDRQTGMRALQRAALRWLARDKLVAAVDAEDAYAAVEPKLMAQLDALVPPPGPPSRSGRGTGLRMATRSGDGVRLDGTLAVDQPAVVRALTEQGLLDAPERKLRLLVLASEAMTAAGQQKLAAGAAAAQLGHLPIELVRPSKVQWAKSLPEALGLSDMVPGTGLAQALAAQADLMLVFSATEQRESGMTETVAYEVDLAVVETATGRSLAQLHRSSMKVYARGGRGDLALRSAVADCLAAAGLKLLPHAYNARDERPVAVVARGLPADERDAVEKLLDGKCSDLSAQGSSPDTTHWQAHCSAGALKGLVKKLRSRFKGEKTAVISNHHNAIAVTGR